MTRNKPLLRTAILLILILATPPPSQSFAQWKTLISLAQSLMNRVAVLRTSRGDSAGAQRARVLAQKLDRLMGVGFLKVIWYFAWDYVKNFGLKDVASADLSGVLKDLHKLLRYLNDLTRLDSNEDRMAWVKRNYANVLMVSKSIFEKLLDVFRHSGQVREAILTVQREVVDGGLLWDCFELGSKDLRGLIIVFKDLVAEYSSSSANKSDL